ncbi:MAG: hypothetical protein ACK4VI_04430 [Alphaproteobacteria bacterium]
MNDTNKKDLILADIVVLAKEHGITAQDIQKALLEAQSGTAEASRSTSLKTVMSYFGGIFIFVGLCTLTHMIWDDLGSATRVIISLGSGLVALVMALACLRDEKFDKATTPLLLIAAALQPTGLFVFLHEYADGDNATLAAMLVFGLMALQNGALFYRFRRTALLFLTFAFGILSSAAAMAWLTVPDDLSALALGLSGLLLSYAASRTAHGAFVPFAYFIAAFGFAYGLFKLIHDIKGLDLLLIAAAASMIYLSVRVQSRSLLVAAIIIMFGYLGYFTATYFADIISWPVALILMGFIMMGLSHYAFKLSREIGK